MAITCITGGRVVDPENKRDEIGDVWIEDGRIVAAQPDANNVERLDASGCVVMAGAIDVHTHVAAGNVSAARLLLPERYADIERPMDHWTGAPFDLFSTGALYAKMGFTLVVEPAVAPTDAVATHAELECIPYVDRASLSVIGNDDVLLGMLRDKASDSAIADYVAWVLSTSRALGAKAINPGGVAALKENVRTFDLDDVVPEYGVTAREIGARLRQALGQLGVPHPLHLHTCNLGIPGNVKTALETIEAAEGLPMHLAHLQFYGYGNEGDLGMSSGAVQLAEAMAKHTNITADIGQVMFGPTVTISSDTLTQFNYRRRAKPKKFHVRDGDANGGGVVPLHYRQKSKINVLQWAIGLEMFLLMDDPWRVFMTTDHPNGGPFTAYPDLIALLMDREYRQETIATMPEDAMAATTLPSLTREYSLTDIAIMTRAAPARLLGTTDRGHLGTGAVADVAIYREKSNRAAMFRDAEWVLKDGVPIIRNGEPLGVRYGRTLALNPDHDPSITKYVHDAYDHRWGAPPNTFNVPDRILSDTSPFQTVACRQGGAS
jgi:formylmethanofuran dehydrogenase subunit A